MEDKEKIVLRKCRTYDLKEIKSSILSIFESLGGVNKFFSRGEKILIKPNLLSARLPEEGVTTHPSIVKAVAEIIIENGGIPYIGDSPSIESFQKVVARTGMQEISREMGIRLISFEDSVNVDFKEGEFKKLEVARPVLEVDKIVNIAKLKTHTQFILTLGVKNMFGIVPGRRKAECHIRFGNDLLSFSKFLIDLYRFKKPVITIIDGILGMDGNGPANGRKRWFGILIGSENALAIDTFISYFSGLGDGYSIVKAGEKMGIKGSKIDEIEIINGDSFVLLNFKLPDSTPPSKRFSFFTTRLKSSLPRPFINRELCKLCMLCTEVCQTDSIKKDSKGLKIDYRNCISCFCCQEVCPYNAIEIKRGILGEILRKL